MEYIYQFGHRGTVLIGVCPLNYNKATMQVAFQLSYFYILLVDIIIFICFHSFIHLQHTNPCSR